jgi:hypothetical protein
MQPLISEYKQKFLSSVIATTVSFLGFEALSLILGQTYQIRHYMWVAFYVYVFHVLWLLFLFDLHLKKRGVLAYARANHQGLVMFVHAFKLRVDHVLNWHYLRHYLNYLILPTIMYWSVVVLMAINPFQAELKQFIILGSTFSLGVAYWYLKEVFSKNFELHHFGVKVLSLVKLLAAYFFYAAIIGYTFYFGLSVTFLFICVAGGTFLLLYQALFQRRLVTPGMLLIIFLISLILAFISVWIFNSWNENYLSAGLIMLAIYNAAWGMLHHHLDNNLTRRLVFEYLLLLFLVLSIVLAGHDFTPRIR